MQKLFFTNGMAAPFVCLCRVPTVHLLVLGFGQVDGGVIKPARFIGSPVGEVNVEAGEKPDEPVILGIVPSSPPLEIFGVGQLGEEVELR